MPKSKKRNPSSSQPIREYRVRFVQILRVTDISEFTKRGLEPDEFTRVMLERGHSVILMDDITPEIWRKTGEPGFKKLTLPPDTFMQNADGFFERVTSGTLSRDL